MRTLSAALRRHESAFWRRWHSRIDRRISLTVGLLLIVVGLGQITAGAHIRSEFYGTVAQVLPVLILAAALEGRYFRDRHPVVPFDRFVLRSLLLVPVAGEAAALVTIARGRDALLLRGTTLTALALAGILIVALAVRGPARAPD